MFPSGGGTRVPRVLLREIGILPVWICPIGGGDPQAKFRSIRSIPGPCT